MVNSAYERKGTMRLQSMVGAILCGAICSTGLLMLGPGADEAKAATRAASTTNPVAAPNFVGINAWLSSSPLNIGDLRGKVVLVDFWTYGCYNCVNTLPHVTRLYDTYKDKGLIVVGVHTPEFPFEKSTDNMQAAIKRYAFDIRWRKTTNMRPGTPTTINIGLRSILSTRMEGSCSNMLVRVSMRRLNGRFRNSSTSIAEQVLVSGAVWVGTERSHSRRKAVERPNVQRRRYER
jgi:thiol-disulfide isomerase/thioredoxin